MAFDMSGASHDRAYVYVVPGTYVRANTEKHSNEDQICLVKILECTGLGGARQVLNTMFYPGV